MLMDPCACFGHVDAVDVGVAGVGVDADVDFNVCVDDGVGIGRVSRVGGVIGVGFKVGGGVVFDFDVFVDDGVLILLLIF